MFKLDLSPTFEAPVRFTTQSPTGAARVTNEFTGVFPRMSEAELVALGQEIEDKRLLDSQVAPRLLKGWGNDIHDGQGNVLACTPDHLAQVLNVAGVSSAVVAAFRAAQPKAALGN